MGACESLPAAHLEIHYMPPTRLTVVSHRHDTDIRLDDMIFFGANFRSSRDRMIMRGFLAFLFCGKRGRIGERANMATRSVSSGFSTGVLSQFRIARIPN
jgi:hypothetical protein